LEHLELLIQRYQHYASPHEKQAPEDIGLNTVMEG
jgi:hypothetical protein